MTIELREALAGVDDAVAATLAANDIVTLEDAADLTAADLDGSLGIRNKIMRAVKPSFGAATAAALTGSVKNLLSSLPTAFGSGGAAVPISPVM